MEIVRLEADRAIASGHVSMVKPLLNSVYHPKCLHVDTEKPQSLRSVVEPLCDSRLGSPLNTMGI